VIVVEKMLFPKRFGATMQATGTSNDGKPLVHKKSH
jgi:hypothetical protein